MSEQLLYGSVGFLIGCAIVVAIGQDLIKDHGRKILPGLCVAGVVFGLILAWAINAYIDYAHASAMH